MSGIRDHYEGLLAPLYAWMSGGVEARLEANRRLLRQLDLHPAANARALDLGAGCGFQAIPLAELGFTVTAVDLSPTLLGELKRQAGTLPVHALERDLFPLNTLASAPVDLIVRMGDTLTHLPSVDQVTRLFSESSRMLAPQGALLLSWRDLTRLPEGDARFLPIRSDADRIFTCFLEAVDPERVRVHDIVHERSGAGFTQRVSSYLKLRLAPAMIDHALAEAGFSIQVATAEQGWITRLARKAA